MIGESLLPFIQEHGIIASFLGGLLTGESVILTLAFFAAQGMIPIQYVIIFSTFGMFLSDFIPFSVGRLKYFDSLKKKKKFKKGIEKVDNTFTKYTKNKLFLILFYTKIIYGLSIPTLVYLGMKKTSYKKFAITDFFVVLIYVPIIILLGYLSGKGFRILVNIFDNLRIAIFVVLLLLIGFIFFRKWLTAKLIQKRKL